MSTQSPSSILGLVDQPNNAAVPAGRPSPAAARPASADKPRQQSLASTDSDDGELEDDEPSEFHRAMMGLLPSGLTSMIVHIVILLALALWMLDPPNKPKEPNLVASQVESIDEEEEEEFDDEISLDEPEEELQDPVDTAVMPEEITVADEAVTSEFDDLEAAESVEALDIPTVTEFNAFADASATTLKTHKGGHALAGRGQMQRNRLLRSEGGSIQSQKAVEDALAWIKRNQVPDGGWDFKENALVRGGTCDGTSTARNAATGLALLPYLGAGYTHKEGKYKDQVWGGLNYLIKSMKPHAASRGGSLISGGRNYDHGIATIALAEAYAMTEDSRLRAPTTAAINFVLYAQDPKVGGWMYGPRSGGDTSVTGWQVMALKSAAMAKIPVPKSAFALSHKWLQSVSAESGTYYGYRTPQAGRNATTAAGHLCMMYMGQGKEDPSLQRGVEVISKWGPNLGNLYYSYYASQIIHHMGGEKWEKWNEKMRDPLIAKQNKAGATKGSWKLAGADHGFKHGGRLYTTALAAMMLEVYYRHMPLYKKQGAEAANLEEWDLE